MATDVRGQGHGVPENTHLMFGSSQDALTGLDGVIYDHDDRAAAHWLASSVAWFVVVTIFGMIIATELAIPETFSGIGPLVFSRVRPSHVEGVIYAWLTMMYWGAILHFTPRLLGTRSLYSERLGIWSAWAYNIILIIGFYGILSGASQGREYSEFPWPIDIAILIIFGLNLYNLIRTVNIRHVRPLYVSMWWAIAAPIWVMASVALENVIWRPGVIWGNPSGALPIGIHDAMINWWGNHNLFGLWLTPILIAVTYYYICRMTNTPLFSHALSLISFWGIIFVYAAVGDHHLLQSPTPGWLKTVASVNSVAILIPVFAFFTNVFLTMRGQWNSFLTNLPVRFVLTGFIFYILVNIQGALQAVQPFNVYIHFTYFIIGHSHLALLGGFTILGMGVIYYVLPQLMDKPPFSRALAEWQYWLVTFGFLLFFTAVTIGAFVQGQGWQMGEPEVNVLPSLKLWNIARGVAGGMIFASAVIQAVNMALTFALDTKRSWRRRVSRDVASETPSGKLPSAV